MQLYDAVVGYSVMQSSSCYDSFTMTLITDIAITVITPLADTYADVLQLSPLQAQTSVSNPRYEFCISQPTLKARPHLLAVSYKYS